MSRSFKIDFLPAIIPLKGWSKPVSSGKKILNKGLATSSVTLPALRVKLDFTKSHSSLMMGAINSSIMFLGQGCISPSINSSISFLASSMPSLIDAPLPSLLLANTLAPAFLASATVSSTDLSSITNTSVTLSHKKAHCTKAAMVSCSFNVGIITDTIIIKIFHYKKVAG